MKKLLFIIMAILPLYVFSAYAQWDETSGSGTGDFLKADFPDSIANIHPVLEADTVRADVYQSNNPILWDAPLVAPDTTVIDTTKAWIRFDLNNPVGAKSYYLMENYSGAKKDTLGFACEMAPVVLDNDSAYISIICEDTTKVALDIYVISDGDTILVSTLSGTALRSTWKEHVIPFTAAFAENKPFVAIVRVRLDAGAWVKFSSTLRIK